MKIFIIKGYPKYKGKKVPAGYRAVIHRVEARNKNHAQSKLKIFIDTSVYKYLEIFPE